LTRLLDVLPGEMHAAKECGASRRCWAKGREIKKKTAQRVEPLLNPNDVVLRNR